MKVRFLHLVLILIASLSLSSCYTAKTRNYKYQELAKASIKLGMDINKKNNHTLYLEAAQWIGTPYRYGGTSRHGIDCSGFTCHIYRTVYRKELERNSDAIRKKNCRKRSKRRLKEGDLVFFSDGRSKKKVTHVGVYLKNNKFVHASTTRGVTVSSLNEDYYKKYWISGGRVK